MGSLAHRHKRQALQVLTAGRLREVLDVFELDVEDRRSRDLLVGALADGRRIDFALVLEQLKRDEAARALGLSPAEQALAITWARDNPPPAPRGVSNP